MTQIMNHLAANTDFLQSLFRHTREAVLIVHDDLEIAASNTVAAGIFGYAPSQLAGMHLRELIGKGLPPENLPGDKSMHFNARAIKKDGGEIPVSVTAHPLEDNQSWLLLLDLLDAQDPKKNLDLFRAEKIKADALLDAIPDTIFIQDFKGNFIDYYPSLEKGIIPAEIQVKGRNMAEIFPDKVSRRFAGAIESLRRERRAQHLEFTLEEGRSGYYEARLVPMNDHKVLTIVRDVSHRVAYERALNEERSKLENYLDSAASIFVVLRPDYTIALVNQKLCETFGYPRESLLGRNWLSFLEVRGKRKQLKTMFDRTMEGSSKPTEYFESYIRTRQGEKRLIRWRNALLMSTEGGIEGMVCSGVDISDQKVAEDLLRKSESTNRAILETIPDAILMHNRAGKILSVQEARADMEFFKSEQLTGKAVTEVFPDGVGLRMLEKISDSCVTGQPKDMEFKLDADQGIRYYEVRYVCMDTDRVLAVVRDITRAKSTQKVLDLRNRALEAAGNGILIADARLPDLPVIYCNDAFTRITGYTREEVLGKNCRFLQGRETDPDKVREIREALQKGVECRVVLRNYRKDGTLFWNELNITPISVDGGSPTHFIGVQNDVSELIFEAERKDHTRHVLEAITQDRPLEQIAKTLSDFLGERMPGRHIQLSRWAPADQSIRELANHGMPRSLREKFKTLLMDTTTRCPCREAVRTQKAVMLGDLGRETEYPEFTTELQKEAVRSCWSFPILSSESTVLGSCTLFGKEPGLPTQQQQELLQDALQLTGLAIERHQTRTRLEESNRKLETYAKTLEQDVAERTEEVESTVQKLLQTNESLQKQIQTTREAEHRALASQALFGAIARNFPKGVIMVFDREHRYVHLEGEELDRMGLGEWGFSGRMVGQTPGLSTEQREDIQNKIGETLEGQHLSFEIQLGQNTYSVNSTPLHITEGSGWALFVFSNVTEQKKAEEDLLRALRIEQELNDLKSRFISMASHEFRTPLSAIHSSAILIGKQNEPGKEDKRLRYLKQIKNNVRNLVVILDDFLSLSKLEEGKIACQPAEFDIMDLIRSVLEELEINLKVGQHFSEDFETASLMVFLDQKLVRHILVNLLSNAIKYSPEKTGIYIHIRKTDEKLQIAIRDEGMGIPEDEHGQLFNRFFRAKNSVNIPGTGLGLHIVKHYTELMKGTISFESEVGKGSTFMLALPVELNPLRT